MFDKSETKQAYQYDAKGIYIQAIKLTWMNRSPISGTWQIPAHVTTIEPPAEKDGYHRIFDGTAWSYTDADDDSDQPETTDEPTKQTLKDRVQALEAENATLKAVNDEIKKQLIETQNAIDVIVMGGE